MIAKILALGMLLVSAGVGASVHGAKEPRDSAGGFTFDEGLVPTNFELMKEGEEAKAAEYAKERTALKRELGAAARRKPVSFHGKGHPDTRKAMRLAMLQAKVAMLKIKSCCVFDS